MTEINHSVHVPAPKIEAARWSARCMFPNGEIETLDSSARTAQAARADFERQLAADYEPGGTILEIHQRVY